MPTIGTNKGGLIKQAVRQKLGAEKLKSLVLQYDDLSVEDFKGQVSNETYAELLSIMRDPAEEAAWNAIIAASTTNENEVQAQIDRLEDYIRKFPNGPKADEAHQLLKQNGDNLVPMKLLPEIANVNASSQIDVADAIAKAQRILDEYPNFSRIDEVRQIKYRLDRMVEVTPWKDEWNAIIATVTYSDDDVKKLLGRVNEFIKAYPTSDKLDDAMKMQKELEAKIKGMSSAAQQAEWDSEWTAISNKIPNSVQDYHSLINEVSAFIVNHPNWNRLQTAREKKAQLESALSTLEKNRKAEEEKANAWQSAWTTITNSVPTRMDMMPKVIDLLSQFIVNFPNSPKTQEAQSLKNEYSKVLQDYNQIVGRNNNSLQASIQARDFVDNLFAKYPSLRGDSALADFRNKMDQLAATFKPEPTTTEKPKSKKWVILTIVVVALVILGFVIANMMNDKDDTQSTGEEQYIAPEKVVEQPVEEPENVEPEQKSNTGIGGKEMKSEEKKTKENKAKNDRKESTPKAEEPAKPQDPAWMKTFKDIKLPYELNRGEEVTAIACSANAASITVKYSGYSATDLNNKDREDLHNKRTAIIAKFKNMLPASDKKTVSINVTQLDRNGRKL